MSQAIFLLCNKHLADGAAPACRTCSRAILRIRGVMDYGGGNEGVTGSRLGERPSRLLDEVRRVLRQVWNLDPDLCGNFHVLNSAAGLRDWLVVFFHSLQRRLVPCPSCHWPHEKQPIQTNIPMKNASFADAEAHQIFEQNVPAEIFLEFA